METQEYRKLAEVEDRMWYFRALHALLEERLVKALGPGPARILDGGCGAGGLIRRMKAAHSGWSWTGVDLSPVACGLARERTGLAILEASVEALPFANGSFDAVVYADVLYHVADEAAAMREAHRLLRPGGLFVATAPAYPWLWSYHDEAVQGLRRYTRRGFLEGLTAAGFNGARGTYWNCLLFPFIAVRRKLIPAPQQGSDVRMGSPVAEGALRGVMAVEGTYLRMGGFFPFGCSILAWGLKPGTQPPV